MYKELETAQLELFDLQDKIKEIKKELITKVAKYQIGFTSDKEIEINYHKYVGFKITNATIGGGWCISEFHKKKFNDFWICYTILPNGSNEQYLMSEEQLIKRLK